MKNLTQLIVLAALLAVGFSLGFKNSMRAQSTLTSQQSLPTTGICQPEDRNVNCLWYNPVESCVCYNNGTCVTAQADKCTDCGNLDIYSINGGQCAGDEAQEEESVEAAVVPGQCLETERNLQCLWYNPVESCVCYNNGTCKTAPADRCTDCGNRNIFSINDGNCPGDEGQEQEESVEAVAVAGQCLESERNLRCLVYNPVESCVCYNNGTCETDQADRCTDCGNRDIFSINDGNCPGDEGQEEEESVEAAVVPGQCLETERNLQCLWYNPVESCVCYNNGTCETAQADRCTDCGNRDIFSIANGECGSQGEPAEEEEVVPGQCLETERNQQCLVYNPVDSCVCYNNGTCADAQADRCTDCGNRDIFSINDGNCADDETDDLSEALRD